MGDKATLRMAQQELEDLYLGVPDGSVDLTFRDLASSSLPAAAGHGHDLQEATAAGLARSSTNIFTYRTLEDRHRDIMDGSGGGGPLLQLSSSPSPAAPAPPRSHLVVNSLRPAGGDTTKQRRPGIPHSNICAVCNKYVYLLRHRCLVCGRVYCRRCVGAGMGDMTEGRKCVDCLGRRFSHRYIHRAGDAAAGCLCLVWASAYYPSAKAVAAQELLWAEKGPAPRRRPRHPVSSFADYSSTNTVASASMSINLNSDASMAATPRMNNDRSIGGVPASASSSFVASYAPNPHALPL